MAKRTKLVPAEPWVELTLTAAERRKAEPDAVLRMLAPHNGFVRSRITSSSWHPRVWCTVRPTRVSARRVEPWARLSRCAATTS